MTITSKEPLKTVPIRQPLKIQQNRYHPEMDITAKLEFIDY